MFYVSIAYFNTQTETKSMTLAGERDKSVGSDVIQTT